MPSRWYTDLLKSLIATITQIKAKKRHLARCCTLEKTFSLSQFKDALKKSKFTCLVYVKAVLRGNKQCTGVVVHSMFLLLHPHGLMLR